MQDRGKTLPDRGDIPSNADMDAEELTAIGERLFGRWGWPAKIGAAVGKDSSTVRRWRGGSRIAPVYARIIRDLAAEADRMGDPPWESVHGGRDGPVRALRIVARAQALAAAGLVVAVRVHDEPEGLSITLRIGTGRPIAAASSPGGDFPGLDDMEAALRLASPST